MAIYRARAPLRMSFSGGGTDLPTYCEEHGGQVISCTINKYVNVTVNFPDEEISDITVKAYDLNQESTFPIANLEYDGNFDLVKAVLKHFNIQTGCEVLIFSDLPAGSGMGTSSSLVVALIALFNLYTKHEMNRYEIADLACNIERKELEQAGGYQDQYAAAFGGFNYITFNHKVTVYPLRVSSDVLNELDYRLILCYTGNAHVSAAIQEKVMENYDKVDFQTGMTLLKEYADQLRDILVGDNVTRLDEFGQILHKAWIAKQQLSDKISTNEIDKLYLNAIENGALGGKLLGAGGGGFLLLFVNPLRKYDLIAKLESCGGEIVSFHFDFTGVNAWHVE